MDDSMDSSAIVIERGTHLRRVHFFLVLTSMLVIGLPLFYQNRIAEKAISEANDLLAAARYMKLAENAPLSLARSKWGVIQVSPSPGSSIVIGSGEPRPPGFEDVFRRNSPVFNGKLDGCLSWGAVTRSEWDDFPVEKLPYAVQCVWLSEDRVLFRESVPPDSGVLTVVTPNGLREPTESEHRRAFTTRVSDGQLGECTGWGGVERSEYEEFLVVLEAGALNLESIGCQWVDEDVLLVGPSSVIASEVFVISPNGVTRTDRSALSLLSTKRIMGRRLDQCSRWDEVALVDYSAMLERISQSVDPSQSVLCRWLSEESILLNAFDWSTAPNSQIPEQLRPIVGLAFEVAFPNLSHAERESGSDVGPDGDWSDLPIWRIKEELDRGRLSLEKITVAGIALNRALFLFGAGPLICSLQLYFLLHFRQVSSREFFGFPWIGAYEDLPSRIVFGVSVVLFAPLALIRLATWDGGSQAIFVWMLASVSSGLAAWQGQSLWRYWQERELSD